MAINIPGEVPNDEQEQLQSVLQNGGRVVLLPDAGEGRTIKVTVKVEKED
jgi:hypothetical protein